MYKKVKEGIKNYNVALEINTYMALCLESAYDKLIKSRVLSIEIKRNGVTETIDLKDEIKAIDELRIEGHLGKG